MLPMIAGSHARPTRAVGDDALRLRFLRPLVEAGGGLRRQSAALARKRLAAGLLPVAGGGAAREGLPAVGPVAERVAVPRRLHVERLAGRAPPTARARAPCIRASAARAAPSGTCAWHRPACRSRRSWARIARPARRRDAARCARPRSDWCDRRATTAPRPCSSGSMSSLTAMTILPQLRLQGRRAVQRRARPRCAACRRRTARRSPAAGWSAARASPRGARP